ncbi:MAG: DUF4878 domain-containing protein [Azoarcus sp.]|nr:DUF4878 domain-containing protein [Azoarcus sp.]
MSRHFSLCIRKFSVCWLAFCALALAGCSPSTPQATVAGFTTAIFQNHLDEAAGYLSPQNLPAQDKSRAREMLGAAAGQLYEKMLADGGWEGISVGKPEALDGDQVRVKAVVTLKNGKTDELVFTLAKESEIWKIVSTQ